MNIFNRKTPPSSSLQACERCLSEAELARLVQTDSERWSKRLAATVHTRLDDSRFQAISSVRKPISQTESLGVRSAGSRSRGTDSVLAWAGFGGGNRSFGSLAVAGGLMLCVVALSGTLMPGIGDQAEVCLTCEAIVANLCAI